MAADLHRTAADRLRRVGQRYTESRRALVEVLAEEGRPVTINEIQRVRPELPQSSAYRNLAVLAQAGVVRRVHATTDEFARYELAEDLTEHHHHLVCVSCGTVADVVVPPRLEATVAKVIEGVAADTGFRPHWHQLDLVGLCAACA